MMKNLIILGLLSFMTNITFGQAKIGKFQKVETTKVITKVEFNDPVFEFGEIIDGEKIKNVFTFTNTGKEPLIISSAKGSCGCTVPMWPKEPIRPGETAELLVEFNSKGKGKVGGSLQSKRVTITTNTDPANHYLTIKGKVTKLETEETKSSIPKITHSDVDPEAVSLYPNPIQDDLTIQLSGYASKAGSVEIYNGSGAKIEERKITDFGKALSFPVADYVPGVYTASIKIEGKNRIAKRFVVPASK